MSDDNKELYKISDLNKKLTMSMESIRELWRDKQAQRFFNSLEVVLKENEETIIKDLENLFNIYKRFIKLNIEYFMEFGKYE